MATAFNTQGSLPQSGSATQPLSGTTAVSKALSAASNGIGGLFSFGAPKSPIPAAAPAPVGQTIKNQTIVAPDGTKHTTTYDTSSAPNQTVAAGANTPGYTYVDGKLTSVGGQPTTGTTTGILNSSPPTQSSSNPVGSTNSSILPQTSNTYSGLINNTVNSAQNNASIGQNAANIASQYGKNISDIETRGNNAQAGYLTTGTSPVAEGNAAVIANTQANQVAGQAAAESAALQGTGQQLTAQNQQTTGLLGAAGAAAPIQVPFSNQIINPQTGEATNNSGAAGTLPASAQTFVSSLASQVQNGQMTRDEAASQLNAYGPAGLQALNTALGSNFNTNASNASAGTTATGQQIAAAILPANQALDALQVAFNNLPGIQSTGVPFLNQITQNAAMATGIGRDQASAFQGALNEARARIDGALAGVIGVDAASAQASALLPDNMVASEIPQKIEAAKQYLQNQLQSYTNSGQQNSSSGFTEGQISADGSLIYQNGQWTVK